MADQTQKLVLQWITLFLLVILCIGSFTWFSAPVIQVPTAQEIADKIVIPESSEVDLTSLEEGISDIQLNLDEDEVWENDAESLATAEWEKRDYKDIYDALDDIYGDIDDRDDIEYVRENKDTTFAGMDADDKDAVVTQYVKVKYENDVGDDVKRKLTIETEIDEGEVEDQEIEETI